jgi:hypothetical protein
MQPDARVAVYYAPLPDDPLFTAGASWLGRDPESGAPLPQPDIPNIADITAEPFRALHCRRWPMPASRISTRSALRHPMPNSRAGGAAI